MVECGWLVGIVVCLVGWLVFVVMVMCGLLGYLGE